MNCEKMLVSLFDASAQLSSVNSFGEQKYKIMITKNAHVLIAAGFMGSLELSFASSLESQT